MARKARPRNSRMATFTTTYLGERVVYDPIEGPFRVLVVDTLEDLQDELNEKFQKNWKLVSIASTADSGRRAEHVVIWDTRDPA